MIDLIKRKYAEQDANNLATEPLIPVVQQNEQNAAQQNVQVEVPDQEINVSAAALAIILYVVPITLITYGVIHLNDCPAQKMIDISFIVLGGLTLVTRILNCPYELRRICRKDDFPKNLCLIWLNLIFQLAIIGFFIALCYWIFTIKPATKPEEHDLPNYCELQFYRNTYWGCVVGLVITGLLFTGGCCFICVICVIACREL